MDAGEVADRLYALEPEKFISARDAVVGELVRAGDRVLARQIRVLKKPTTAAWLANGLVRHHPQEMSAFADLGRSLRQAQQQLSGEQLRDLLTQRRRVVAALVAKAREDARAAGHRVGDGPELELTETLQAALADEQAAELLAAGRLTTALHPGPSPAMPDGAATPAGRGGTGGQVAAPQRPGQGPAPAPAAAKQAGRLEQLHRDAERLRGEAAGAEESARRAENEATELEHEAEVAEFDLTEVADRAERARAAVAEAEAERAAADTGARAARERAEAAAASARAARTAADTLTTKLTELDARIAESNT